MKTITREMLHIYKPISGMDWMNYKLVKSQCTYHHIVKREDGGLATIQNGALLMPTAHEYLHIIEYKELQTYIALNKIFELVNKQGYEPTQEQREIIEYLLNQFESVHKEDTNAKGKRLIRTKYTIREYQ